MNRRQAKKRANSETWTWDQMRSILTEAKNKLRCQKSRVNPYFTDREVWGMMDQAVTAHSGEISGMNLMIVQNILREFS